MAKSVTIYTTPTCVYCKATKEFFQEKSVEYSEVDVSKDPEKAREMIHKSGQMGVPVIVIGEGADEQIVVGYDKNKLAELIGIEA